MNKHQPISFLWRTFEAIKVFSTFLFAFSQFFCATPWRKYNLYCAFCWSGVSNCQLPTVNGNWTWSAKFGLLLGEWEWRSHSSVRGLFGYSGECRVRNKNRFMLAAFLSDSIRANFCDYHDHDHAHMPPRPSLPA